MCFYRCLTGPPSAVVNVTLAYKDQSSVKVIWSRPVDLGGRTDLSYSVDCVGCDHKVKFLPRQTGLRSTRSVLRLNSSHTFKNLSLLGRSA